MISSPAALVLQGFSALVFVALACAGFWAYRISEGWDPQSASEGQLLLERRTWLVSSIVSRVCLAQGLSLFLFIHTADSLHRVLPGAMCAAGSLNAGDSGYAALALKTLNAILCGLWLLLHRVDRLTDQMPLVRSRCKLLLGMIPLSAFEAELQWDYFRSLRGDRLTSCCDVLFSTEGGGMLAWVSSLPVLPLEVFFFAVMVFVLASGLLFLRRRKGEMAFAVSGLLSFPLNLAALIAFVSPYLYELPTHHCPFCILQGEYGYIGYLVYASILGGVLCAAGVALLSRYRSLTGLEDILPLKLVRLVAAGLSFHALWTVIVIWAVFSSNLILVEF
ncbi:MAG: hypothetical protein WHT06_10910 [Desulfobacterales bacterium]